MAQFKTRVRMTLRRLGKPASALLLILTVLLVFQNCSPVGDGVGSSTASSTSLNPPAPGAPPPPPPPPPPTPGVVDPCPNLAAPTIMGGPGAQTVRSGQGELSGSVYARNLAVAVQLGYQGQNVQLQCDRTGLGALNVNCNGMNINLTVNDEGDGATNECASGTATVTVRARDTVCNKLSAPFTFTVNVVNACIENAQVRGAGGRLDQFGSRIAVDGTWAVVVSPADDERGGDAGAAFVYRYDGTNWVRAQKLIPGALAAGDEIRSAAISGGVLALGSPYHLNDGAVFIYRLNGATWVETQTLRPSNVNSTLDYDLFGHDVALSGGLLAVGGPGNNHGDVVNRVEAGAVFVFQDGGAGFSEVSVLRASNPAARDFFGGSVAVAGGRVVVGAPSSPVANKAQFSGKAYVYNGTTEVRLMPTAGQIAAGSDFGFSVAGDGDRVVIGAPLANGRQNGSGAAFVFRFDGTGWAQETRLVHSDGATGDNFGYSVAMRGTGVAAGAPGMNTKMGAAYHYTLVNNAWGQRYKLLPRRALRTQQDRFAESVSLGGTFFGAGSRLDDDQELNAGSAFLMRLP